MSYSKGLFPTHEPERQSLRDAKRAEFFASLEVEVTGAPLSVDPDPAAQLDRIRAALATARSAAPEAAADLDTAEALLLRLGLGVGPAGVVLSRVGRPSPSSVSVRALNSFFTRSGGA